MGRVEDTHQFLDTGLGYVVTDHTVREIHLDFFRQTGNLLGGMGL
ncbi:MAG: hypothetical protein AB1445_10520 [Bacillota bacterium]